MPATATDAPPAAGGVSRRSIVIRFAGDSGDGMQLAGTQFTDTSAIFGNDVATFPDFPAEIRAPPERSPACPAFKFTSAATTSFTPATTSTRLIAMNPAGLKAHLKDVTPGGLVIVNDDEFTKTNLKKAGYPTPDGSREPHNPLDDEELFRNLRLHRVPVTKLNQEVLKAGNAEHEWGLDPRSIARCRNMWVLGLVYWLFDRPLTTTEEHLNQTFAVRKKLPSVAAANIQSLRAGWNYGETAEIVAERARVEPADIAPGIYRKVTGNEALAMGLITGGNLAGKGIVYATYPITPASDILHNLAPMKHFGVKTVQAEDEIAAVCAAIGASFAGEIGITGTSGPGLALKAEAMGLAVVTELPLVVINVQRGGPSTGLPTKTEQSDLLQAMYGRNGDAPVVVLAPDSPGDCFRVGIEAIRIALTRMVPVVILTDGYLANGSEPWEVPSASDFEPIVVKHMTADKIADPEGEGFLPYDRDEHGARPWAIPGTPGVEHRIGGLEKQDRTGNVSYDPDNHQRMTDLRAGKVAAVVDLVPDIEATQGPQRGPLLVLGWGGTHGSITAAVQAAHERGQTDVAQAHLRHLNPFPKNLGAFLAGYERVLIPELNMGQLLLLIRGTFCVPAVGVNKVKGKPFLVEELLAAIDEQLKN